MQKIPIANALPGMVLAQDVNTSDRDDGPPLCGNGCTLTASLIERLKQMGVQTLVVEGHPLQVAGATSLEESLSILDRRFKHVADDPHMMMLKEIYRKHLIKSFG
jgi:hypothetical protein